MPKIMPRCSALSGIAPGKDHVPGPIHKYVIFRAKIYKPLQFPVVSSPGLSNMDPLIRTHNPLPMDPTVNRVTKTAISRSSLDSIPTSFATASLGAPTDSLEAKLSAIASAGYQGIEFGFPDLVSFASTKLGKEIKEDDYDSLCKAGEEVRKLCGKHKLRIMMLQPLARFEGWKKGSDERKASFARAEGWIRVMQSLGTDMLQVGSSDASNISANTDEIVCDLRELADMLSKHQFRLAYENWAWSTHAYVITISLRDHCMLTLFTDQHGNTYGILSRQSIDPTLVSA